MPKPKTRTLTAASKRRIEQAMQQGLALHQAGRMREAEALYRQVLAQQPAHPAASHLLGLVLMQQGNAAAAVELISKAVAQRPQDPQYHCNLGVALNASGQPERAVLSFSRAIELKPDYAEAWSNRGMALKNDGRPAEAAESYRKAIALKPGEAGFHMNLGNAHTAAGDLHEAEAAYSRALDLRPDYPAALSGLSQTLQALGRADEAIARGLAAVTSRPNDIEYQRTLGRAYRAAGQTEQAAACFRRALLISPDHAEVHRSLADLVVHSAHNEQITAMETLFASAGPGSDDRMHLGYALGRAFDDLGDYPRSIEYFTEGNAIRRRAARFSLEQARRDLDVVLRLFDSPPPAALLDAGFSGEAPIFILGLPRSGKTSLEGMIARHPQVYGAGELRTFAKLADDLIAKHDLTAADSSLRTIPAADIGELGREYSRVVRQLASAPTVVVDTMPPNFRLIGFIRLALPRARVIHCVRDPLEHAIALFQTHFARHGYEYTCDWNELSAFYGFYREVMAKWHRRFPGFVRDVDFAAVQADPEQEMRKILRFCNLEWTEECAQLHESEPRLGARAIDLDRREKRRRHYYSLLSGIPGGRH